MPKVISSFHELDELVSKGNIHRILCLYSGGLDGTYLLNFLNDLSFKNSLALHVDVGDELNKQELQETCQKFNIPLKIIDAKKTFLEEYVYPSIYCQSLYLGQYPISASLTRPLMAQLAVESIANNEDSLILHTSNSSQNSLRRFNNSFRMLGFKGHYGSPFIQEAISRADEIETLSKVGLNRFHERICSFDTNLWCREFEYGILDDPEQIEIPESFYQYSKLTFRQNKSEVSVAFENGMPVALNGHNEEFHTIIVALNQLVGSYGLGRYVGLEEIESGKKVQEIREMPAAFLLLDAYKRLESASLSAEAIREKMHMEQLWVREASEGRWFGALRKAAQQFALSLAQHVTGEVKYQLQPFNMRPLAVKAQSPLYIRSRKAYEEGRSS